MLQVEGFIGGGILSPEEGQSFIFAGNSLIDQLSASAAKVSRAERRNDQHGSSARRLCPGTELSEPLQPGDDDPLRSFRPRPR